MISVSFSVVYVIQLEPIPLLQDILNTIQRSLLKPLKPLVSFSASLFEPQSLYTLPFPNYKNIKRLLR